MARYNKEQIKAMQEEQEVGAEGLLRAIFGRHRNKRQGVSDEESSGALLALNKKQNNIYQGITTEHMNNSINRRRAKTRVARKTKQAQRGRRH